MSSNILNFEFRKNSEIFQLFPAPIEWRVLKAQRNFSKLDILPNNIFLDAEQRRIGKTYTRVDVFCGGA